MNAPTQPLPGTEMFTVAEAPCRYHSTAWACPVVGRLMQGREVRWTGCGPTLDAAEGVFSDGDLTELRAECARLQAEWREGVPG